MGLLVALAIAGTSIDGFDAGRVWLYITIVAVGYMVSRGIAKSQRGRGRRRDEGLLQDDATTPRSP